jgi:hypothetical protein
MADTRRDPLSQLKLLVQVQPPGKDPFLSQVDLFKHGISTAGQLSSYFADKYGYDGKAVQLHGYRIARSTSRNLRNNDANRVVVAPRCPEADKDGGTAPYRLIAADPVQLPGAEQSSKQQALGSSDVVTAVALYQLLQEDEVMPLVCRLGPEPEPAAEGGNKMQGQTG